MIIKFYIKNCKNILCFRMIEKLKLLCLLKSVDVRLLWVFFFFSKIYKYKIGDLDFNVFFFKFFWIYWVDENFLYVFSICILILMNCDDDEWFLIFVYLYI